MKCLSKHCTAEDHCRGLCKRCYCRQKYRVAHKIVTWGELIAAGLARKAERHNGITTARRRANAVKALATKTQSWPFLHDLDQPTANLIDEINASPSGPPPEPTGEVVV